jgi:hypothetical protein
VVYCFEAEGIFQEGDEITARPSASRNEESVVQMLEFVLFTNREMAEVTGFLTAPQRPF